MIIDSDCYVSAIWGGAFPLPCKCSWWEASEGSQPMFNGGSTWLPSPSQRAMLVAMQCLGNWPNEMREVRNKMFLLCACGQPMINGLKDDLITGKRNHRNKNSADPGIWQHDEGKVSNSIIFSCWYGWISLTSWGTHLYWWTFPPGWVIVNKSFWDPLCNSDKIWECYQ